MSPIHDSPNLLLRALSNEDRDLLAPSAERRNVEKNMMIDELDKPVEAVSFMENCIASCVAVEGSTRTEVGLIGYEGMTGATAVLGDSKVATETFIQVDHGRALRVPLPVLSDAMGRSITLRTTLLRYVGTFLLQVTFGLVASAQHMMEARLARWLLMCHDRVDGDEVPLTHEFMAMMIAAQRSGVTMTLHNLEGAGMIRSTRGLVTILNRPRLVELAGGSYGVPEEHYSALIAPFGKNSQPEPLRSVNSGRSAQDQAST